MKTPNTVVYENLGDMSLSRDWEMGQGMLLLMVATPLFSPWVSSAKEPSLTSPSTSDMLGGLVVPFPFGQFLSRLRHPETGERVPAVPDTSVSKLRLRRECQPYLIHLVYVQTTGVSVFPSVRGAMRLPVSGSCKIS